MTDTITITIKESDTKLSLKKGESFFRLLREKGLFDTEHCGGIGKCGRCLVRFFNNAPLPTPSERRLLKPEELRDGMRMACVTKPFRDCEIMLCFPKKRETFILDHFQIEKEKLTPVSNDETMIITDLGTTTLAMLLVDKNSGKILKSFRRVNPQRKYGSDVISRIEAGLGGKAGELAGLIRETIEEGVAELGGNPQFMALAGNTAMIYLLLQYDLTGLSREPFTAQNREEIVTELGIRTYIMPGISTFVGGDISAGIYALLELKGQSVPDNDSSEVHEERGAKGTTSLLLDLGTNGEMALLTEDDIFVTATAAGPAFEGRTNLWGRDMVKLVADFLDNHMIDSYGTIQEPYREKGIQVGEVNITQDDIRAIQLAKAAVRTGIEVLCKQAEAPVESIKRVYLAGGFGYYIDCERAARIGLLPKELAKKAETAGNTALLGLFLKYRKYDDSVTNKTENDPVMDRIFRAKAFNLARVAEFEDNYIGQINF